MHCKGQKIHVMQCACFITTECLHVNSNCHYALFKGMPSLKVINLLCDSHSIVSKIMSYLQWNSKYCIILGAFLEGGSSKKTSQPAWETTKFNYGLIYAQAGKEIVNTGQRQPVSFLLITGHINLILLTKGNCDWPNFRTWQLDRKSYYGDVIGQTMREHCTPSRGKGVPYT